MAEAKTLTRANIAEAISAIEAYESTCNGLYQSFQGTLNSLTSTNWIGEGSEGCKYFFNGTVTPALTEGVTSLTKALKDILTNVEETFIGQLDPQLGEANRNPGGGA